MALIISTECVEWIIITMKQTIRCKEYDCTFKTQIVWRGRGRGWKVINITNVTHPLLKLFTSYHCGIELYLHYKHYNNTDNAGTSRTVIVRGGKRNSIKSTVNKVKFFQMHDINIFAEPFALVRLFWVVSSQAGWPSAFLSDWHSYWSLYLPCLEPVFC